MRRKARRDDRRGELVGVAVRKVYESIFKILKQLLASSNHTEQQNNMAFFKIALIDCLYWLLMLPNFSLLF